jgi:hypothetical protein
VWGESEREKGGKNIEISRHNGLALTDNDIEVIPGI